jgi:hypothetical protein
MSITNACAIALKKNYLNQIRELRRLSSSESEIEKIQERLDKLDELLLTPPSEFIPLKTMTITREQFVAAVQREPEQDDLSRCNCPKVGEIGHYYCGWCEQCNKPRFICGHVCTRPTNG